MNKKYLTAEEAVAYLGLPSLGALYALNARRQLPFIKFGRRVRYLESDLDEFLGRSRVAALSDSENDDGGRS